MALRPQPQKRSPAQPTKVYDPKMKRNASSKANGKPALRGKGKVC